jgi:hypothetical protein
MISLDLRVYQSVGWASKQSVRVIRRAVVLVHRITLSCRRGEGQGVSVGVGGSKG